MSSNKFAEVNGVRLHYVEEGSGSLLILIHGFPDFWFTWRNQIPVLAAAGFRVVAIDARGYNLSEKPKGVKPYQVESLCKDIEQLIRHFATDKAYIIGHDWGGTIGWYFSMLYPDLVERLVIINVPHPHKMMEGLKTLRQLRKSWYVFFFQIPLLPEAITRAGNYKLVRKVFALEPAKPFTDSEIDIHVKAISQPGALTSAINYYRAVFTRSFSKQRALWKQINVPVLILWGDKDTFLGSELAEPDEEWVSNATVQHFPNAGHWLHHDEAEKVNEWIINFLKP